MELVLVGELLQVVLLGGDLRELGGGDGQRGAGVVHPEQRATGGREAGQDSLHDPLVGVLDLAPLGVVVAGQGVLLLLVDPAAVPEPSPSVSRRRGTRLKVAHAMTNPSLGGGSSSTSPSCATSVFTSPKWDPASMLRRMLGSAVLRS